MSEVAFFIFKSEFESQWGREIFIFFTAARAALGIMQPVTPQPGSSGAK
jgi:hypothetical protein